MRALLAILLLGEASVASAQEVSGAIVVPISSGDGAVYALPDGGAWAPLGRVPAIWNSNAELVRQWKNLDSYFAVYTIGGASGWFTSTSDLENWWLSVR